jgi:PncC family amidohydrolase
MAGFPQARWVDLDREALRVARLLSRTGTQLVLAESCTGGLVGAALARIPGISRHLCGSSVVYQSETKAQWLNIPNSFLKRHGTESRAVTERLARQILALTPQANFSAAITGDLGPLPSDPKKVGRIFMACAIKTRGAIRLRDSREVRLGKPRVSDPEDLRTLLQHAASKALLRMVRQLLSDTLRQHRGN